MSIMILKPDRMSSIVFASIYNVAVDGQSVISFSCVFILFHLSEWHSFVDMACGIRMASGINVGVGGGVLLSAWYPVCAGRW